MPRITPLAASALLLCAGLALAIPLASAEERRPDKAKTEQAPDAKPKEEARDLFKLGATGKAEGAVVAIDAVKGRLVLKTKDGNLLFVPRWRGGASGGLDKGMLAEMAKIKVGDKLAIDWWWEDRRRIEKMAPLK